MFHHVAFGACLAFCLTPLAWALASPARWPSRLAAGLAALALWMAACPWLTARNEKAVWGVALLVTLVVATKGLTIAAAFWRRLATQRDFERIAEQLYPEAPGRVSLGELFANLTAVAMLAAAAGGAARLVSNPWDRAPVGVSFAATVAIGVAAAIIAGAIIAALLSAHPDARSVALLAALWIGVTVGIEFLMNGLLAFDETFPKSMGARDLLKSMSGRWWEWTASVTASATASALALRAAGWRWVEWPYD